LLEEGKISPRLLRKIVSLIGAKKNSVIIGPGLGFDSGVARVKERIVVSTDPVVGVPEELLGFFIVCYAANDVSVFGGKPEFLVYDLLVPVGFKEDRVVEICERVSLECRRLGMSVLNAHTGAYSAIKTPIATSTVIGVAEKLVSPFEAKPGDKIVVIGEVGGEMVTALSYFNPRLAEELLGKGKAREYREKYRDQLCVREALKLAREGVVRAMHDVTEGGLSAALPELADASKLGLRVEYEKIPFSREAQIVCKALNGDVLAASSTGTIIALVPPEKLDDAIAVIKSFKKPFSIIGEMTYGEEKVIIRNGREEEFPEYVVDPYSKLLAKNLS